MNDDDQSAVRVRSKNWRKKNRQENEDMINAHMGKSCQHDPTASTDRIGNNKKKERLPANAYLG